MSLDATVWAWKATVSCASERLVLLALADRAGDDHKCFPSLKRLEKDTTLNRKTIIKVLDELELKSLIKFTGEIKGNGVKVYQLIGVFGREDSSDTSTKKATSTKNDTGVNLGTGSNNGTSTNNGTGTSTNFGTETSTNFGTQNLPRNLPLESKNKKDWLCLKKLCWELDQADPTVVPKSIIEASWFEREKRAFELFNADKDLCDDLLIYHFADTLLRNRHKYDKAQNGKSSGESDSVFFSSPQQIYVFANKLAQLPDVINQFSLPGESFEKLASRIAAKLSDPNELQNWKSQLQMVGFKSKSRGVA
ncbi:helix-turn-helix domain-containing protein [Acinetobacter bereziniae]|uniref:Helix-turn-helix domain-containing protein n=1 Tax=Acinetobacter bereziniae TaxID=106648 RepID=A0A8I1AN14_ACIBZ|nr:helix-turn-helix domain-containing protein [Acinetobacter bereziniae]MCM8511574.1 helix-turn-helix domain-containing protein [Acinetobacter bereziniae]QQC82828.1 helix-turn-helix domain-containing protein [Acinetobacter bereziniae]UUN95972.1 helix-turn-helix domain-containing protein [Acinetobacter bereziniae]